MIETKTTLKITDQQLPTAKQQTYLDTQFSNEIWETSFQGSAGKCKTQDIIKKAVPSKDAEINCSCTAVLSQDSH